MALVKYNNNSISAITAASSLPTGAMTLIKEQTASSSSTISFVHGTSDVVLDSTYPIYLFKFINIHVATDNAEFEFNVSIDGGSNYNVAKTTTWFQNYHNEGDTAADITYETGQDLANGTGVSDLTTSMGADNDQSLSGDFWLFNPSSTTFVKHFITRTHSYNGGDYAFDIHTAGYVNSTSAVNAIQFSTDTGNIDAGDIKLYGIKDS